MAESQLAVQVSVEVLAPQLDLTDVLAKTVAIEELFETAFIPTDRASQYFRWLDESRLLKQCGRVIGPRGVGKKRSSKHYQEEDRKRVSYVEAWSNTSSRKLFSTILGNINHGAPRGKRQDLRPRLAGSLKLFRIELLIIDNAQNLQQEALVDLNQLYEESGIPIILSGEPELDTLLGNFDLRICFPNLFEFDRLDYEDFQKTLRTIELDILALPEASNLSEGILFETLVSSTEAHIGLLIKILTKAVTHSLKKGYGKVDKAILHNIASRYGKPYIPIKARKSPELGEG
ncbi:ATP-binding protein [Leptolyngbya sp. FACHB-671]|uniref:AAA family ATPase n=1 Tax=Leptolyngbya sp. FACHB-671 TaxID=2692812 RepID=UPI001682A9CF|nr:AAA family ATPase [Leptolyngbya sp. FACHB-671]MBD2070300.1 ATP-binding protein [Leptolyngbya sp. FACHB-671]